MNALTHRFIDVKSLTTILLLIFGSVLLENSFIFAEAPTAITSTTGIGDLGTKTITQGHTIQIVGGTRSDQGSGTNLFHSFDQFSVGDGYTAQFLNTTPSLRTHNILSRVTGGDHSSIFGTIDSTSYPGANLFLMNPAGIVVGPNATLDVGGSVAFTTADYLRLAQANGSNAGIFRADPRATPQLSSAPVAAFGFLGDNPAAIAVQKSALNLQPGQSISLIGGNITIQSGILAETADPLPPRRNSGGNIGACSQY
jgi:filamentous hemagglutinin family protein